MRYFLAVVISVIILPMMLVSVLAWILFSDFGQPGYLKKALSDQNAYEKIVNLAPELLKETATSDIKLTDQDKIRLLKVGLPAPEMQSILETNLDAFYAWLKGNPKYKVDLDFVATKERFRKELMAILKERYARLPECTLEELSLLANEQGSMPSCRVPSSSRIENFDANKIAKDAIKNFPDKTTYQMPKSLDTLPFLYQRFSLGLKIISACLIFGLGLIILLLWPWPKTMLRWLGILFILIGLPLITMVYFGIDLAKESVLTEVSDKLTNVSDAGQDLVMQLINSILVTIRSQLNYASLVILGLGVLLIVISAFVRSKRSPGHQTQKAS